VDGADPVRANQLEAADVDPCQDDERVPRFDPDEVRPREVQRNVHFGRTKKPYYAKRAEVRQQLEDIASQTLKAIEGVYDVVVIDPPWPVAFQAREARPQQVALAYPTMTLEEIQALRLPPCVAVDDAALSVRGVCLSGGMGSHL
jgi:hypothetical protein